MSATEYFVFLIILLAGIYIFRLVRSSGLSQRSQLEESATQRLNKYLSELDANISEYRFYTRLAGTSDAWRQVNLDTMRKDILDDCEVGTVDAFNFQKARFSAQSVPERKEVYYVAGDDNYKFGPL